MAMMHQPESFHDSLPIHDACHGTYFAEAPEYVRVPVVPMSEADERVVQALMARRTRERLVR